VKIKISMGNVWDRTTDFLGDRLSAIVPIALLAIVVPTAVSTLIEPAARTGGGTTGGNVAGLILAIVELWGQLAIVALALHPGAGRGPALRIAAARLLPLIAIVIILMLALFLVLLPMPIALAMSGVDLRAAMGPTRPVVPVTAGWFVTLYLLVLFPVLLFIAAHLLLLTPVIVAERLGLRAIARSFALGRGLVWKILGVVILYAIVAGVATMAANTVFGSIFRILLGGDGAMTLAALLTALIAAIVQAVFVVMAAAFTAKLYLAVRDARDQHAAYDSSVEPV